MAKEENKDTRYFIDLDLKTGRMIHWDHGDRFELISQKPAEPFHHRVFLTKGQYNKLLKRLHTVEPPSPAKVGNSLAGC